MIFDLSHTHSILHIPIPSSSERENGSEKLRSVEDNCEMKRSAGSDGMRRMESLKRGRVREREREGYRSRDETEGSMQISLHDRLQKGQTSRCLPLERILFS